MNKTNKLIPEKNVIMPTKRRYLFRAAMNHSADIPEALNSVINKIYKEGLELAKPVIYWKHFPVKTGIRRNNNKVDVFPAHLLPAKLAGASGITLFASTLGAEIDKQIEQYINEAKTLEGALLDAWASEAVETLNIWFDSKLRSEHGQGTMRFSPGYGDLPITSNTELITELLKIDAIKADKNTGILNPRKSTVCLIGWMRDTEGVMNESR